MIEFANSSLGAYGIQVHRGFESLRQWERNKDTSTDWVSSFNWAETNKRRRGYKYNLSFDGAGRGGPGQEQKDTNTYTVAPFIQIQVEIWWGSQSRRGVENHSREALADGTGREARILVTKADAEAGVAKTILRVSGMSVTRRAVTT